jgi:hypothetical protein
VKDVEDLCTHPRDAGRQLRRWCRGTRMVSVRCRLSGKEWIAVEDVDCDDVRSMRTTAAETRFGSVVRGPAEGRSAAARRGTAIIRNRFERREDLGWRLVMTRRPETDRSQLDT